MKKKTKLAIVRGKFLNQYEMQSFAPLTSAYDITAFASLTPFHDQFSFPVVKIPSPMDIPDFPWKMQILNRLFIDAHYLFGLERKLQGFDIVHSAETYYHYTKQALDAKKKGYVKKVVATALENIPFNNEGIWGRTFLKKYARTELDHIIALTGCSKDALLKEGADHTKITVIGHGIDTRRFQPSQRMQKGIGDPHLRTLQILFVGRLEVYKGILDLWEAYTKILKDPDIRGYRVKLTFIGDGSLARTLKEKIQEAHLTRFVTMKKSSYTSMPNVYQSAHLFFAPSKPTTTWAEQYNTSLLEAQAAGLPIVTTRSGGIPENVGDAAIIVSPGDIKSLAHAMKKLILDAALRMRLAKSARSRAVHVHDSRIIAARLHAVYQKVLDQA